MRNFIKILIVAIVLLPTKSHSIESNYFFINLKNNFNELEIKNNVFMREKEYRNRTRIKKIPKCEEEQNVVGYAATSSFLIAMKPEPLPKCTPIRVPKV